MNAPKRFIWLATLMLLIPVEAPALGYGSGGASGDYGFGQAAGQAVAVVGVGLIAYFVWDWNTAISGCVQADNGMNTLVDYRNKRKYAIVGSSLKTGERLKLRGTKVKAQDGTWTFRVRKISHDYGAC